MTEDNEIEEVKCWKTEDGKIFESEDQAKTWQDFLKFKRMINEIITDSGSLYNYDNTKEDVIHFLIKNSEKFKKVFMKFNVSDFSEFIDEEFY